jgi:solute carrier family 25 protein 38
VPWSGLQFTFYRFLTKLHDSYFQAPRSPLFVFLAGAGTSLLAMLVVYPFDNLRVRRQTEAGSEGAWHMGRRVLRTEGGRGLYRGVEAKLVKKGLSGGALWSVYRVVNKD